MIFNLLHNSVMKIRSRLNMLNKLIHIYNVKFVETAIKFASMTIPNVQPVYFIAWENNSEFDNSMNSMKAKAFQFLNSLMQKKEKLIDASFVDSYTVLVQSCISNLQFVITDKFSYIQEMDKESNNYPDYNYENLIYQILLFLSKILIREPFVETFRTYDKK
jgi:hypothetical protein